MMKQLLSVLKISTAVFTILFIVGGCGTGGLGDTPSTGGGGGTTTSPAAVDLLVSSPQLSSDSTGTNSVTLTAIVKDSNNVALKDQEVTFSASSGTLGIVNATTDENGVATAKLTTGGDPTYRTINLTATAGGKTGTNAVTVTGTALNIDPSSFSLLFNDPTGKELTVTLKDSSSLAIPGKTISIASTTGNSTFEASSYVTDNSGQVKVTVKNALDTTEDTITASAIGVSSQAKLTIDAAELTVNEPAAAQEINVNTAQTFKVTYKENGVPVSGKAINFTATRGTLSAASSPTNAAGVAEVTVTSTNSGPSVLTASTTATSGSSVSKDVSVLFIATVPTKMDLSSYPSIIGTNAAGQDSEQSLIKAIVRDKDDNLVKGKTVKFSVVTDPSSGKLSKASSETDIYGTAETSYIAGGASSGLNGVHISAAVDGAPAVTDTATLTVAGEALFITLATGPDIKKVDPNKYQKDYVALVTDAAGHPQVGVNVDATVTPVYYRKGYWDNSSGAWKQIFTLTSYTDPAHSACLNEDAILHDDLYDYNGVLDPGEDQNANSRLEPGNVVSVTATQTDSSGHSTVSLVYARDYAYWVNVKLEVRASLSGSTFNAVQYFDLPGLADDYLDHLINVPGNPSPFGTSNTCFDTL